MKKLLLVLLALALVGGDVRAEGIAGGGPSLLPVPVAPLAPIAPLIPSAPSAPELGIVTLTVQKIRTVAYRLAGRAIGSLVRKGMTEEQVKQILGQWDVHFGGRRGFTCFYLDLGVDVTFTIDTNAAGEFCRGVASVEYMPLFL